ncbi:MAG TPA: tRNA pseudouridine(38-40) synthase TruA [Paludibacteraceae bacterium]|nr:tRNA pseudouridine(38-40) synthase TruA [Paludibacteraceae bacterium]HPS10018.1 tRNA pseudouridine(38-40) synthase TruA [Paludibacteraceae bacterium]
MKRRYFIRFAYDGTAYCGWQVQPNGLSVQEVLTKALCTILRTEDIEIVAAGRTDAGVHARNMVAHFDVEDRLPAGLDLVNKLNSLLPSDISVIEIREVKPEVHARFDALSRRYEYHLVLQKDVFRHPFAMRIYNPLDFDRMNEAAKILFEYTDFTSFSKLHTDVKTNNCKIMAARWEQREEEWIFIVEADRFLRNMVRAIVGTLLEVGRGKMTIDEFRQVIDAKNRCNAGSSVPAKGLFLVEVAYPENIYTGD